MDIAMQLPHLTQPTVTQVLWDAACEQQGGPTTTLPSAGTASRHAAAEEQVQATQHPQQTLSSGVGRMLCPQAQMK